MQIILALHKWSLSTTKMDVATKRDLQWWWWIDVATKRNLHWREWMDVETKRVVCWLEWCMWQQNEICIGGNGWMWKQNDIYIGGNKLLLSFSNFYFKRKESNPIWVIWWSFNFSMRWRLCGTASLEMTCKKGITYAWILHNYAWILHRWILCSVITRLKWYLLKWGTSYNDLKPSKTT